MPLFYMSGTSRKVLTTAKYILIWPKYSFWEQVNKHRMHIYVCVLWMYEPILSILRKRATSFEVQTIYHLACISPNLTRGLKWYFSFPDISVSLDLVSYCLQKVWLFTYPLHWLWKMAQISLVKDWRNTYCIYVWWHYRILSQEDLVSPLINGL